MGWEDAPLVSNTFTGNNIDIALNDENITGHKADVIRSIYEQESSSGKNTKTSNQGAVGGMQIIPSTFKSVADKDWDINNPEHNLKAGIRYASNLYDKNGGDAKLTAIGYYGGEGAIEKAKKGIEVKDKKNPNAPTTLQYAEQVSRRVPVKEKQSWEDAPLVVEVNPTSKVITPKEKSLATQAEESLNAAAFGIPVGTIGRSITHGIAKIPSELINLGSAIGGKAVEGVNSLIGDPSLNSGKNPVNDYINKSEAQYQQEVPDSFASNLGGVVGAVAPFAVGGLKSGLDRTYNFAQKPVEKMLSSHTSLANPLSHVAGGISSGAALTPFIGVGGESENYFTDKAKQLGINMGLGGMISGAIPAVRGTYNWLADSFAPAKDLLSKGGAENIANRYINSKLVNETTRPSIIADLNKSPAVIAGNEATSSQALANNPAGTQIQAHQNIVSQEPIASHKFGERIANQIELHKNMFNWAGTPDDITRLTTLRTKAVAPLYKIVEKSNKSVSVKDTLDKLTNTIDKNIHNDAIANPLTSIKDKLLIKDKDGFIIGFERNPQRLKSLSDDISDMMKATSDNKPKYNLSVLREIKSSLDKEIGDVVPAYRKALDVFQKRSVPINQMEIGQHLKGKLTSISGKESPNDFINTLNNEKKLLKDTIGFGRTDIENILTPQQMGLVNKVTENLERNLASKNPLQKTNLRGGINVANETTVSLPNLLSRPAMFTNYVMKSLGRSKEPEIDAYFAKLYLNPQELAKVLSQVPPTQRSAVNSRLQTFGRAYIANRTKENQ